MPQERSIHSLDATGTIIDWLVAPAFSWPAEDISQVVSADSPVWQNRWRLTNGPDVMPVKAALYELHRLPGSAPQAGNYVGDDVQLAEVLPAGLAAQAWQRYHCAADGLVDWSEFCFFPSYRVGIARAILEVDQASPRQLEVSCTGPWQLFVNGELHAAADAFGYMEPLATTVELDLASGLTTLDFVTWQVAFRECRQILRARIIGLPTRVVVPEHGADERACEWGERLLDQIGLTRWASTEPVALLTGPKGLAVRVARGGVHVTGTLEDGVTAFNLHDDTDVQPGVPAALARHQDVEIQLADPRIPLVRRFPMTVLPDDFQAWPLPDSAPADWHSALLGVSAERDDVAGAVSAARLGRPIRPEQLTRAMLMIRDRADCADFEALGVLNLLYRTPVDLWPAGLREELTELITGLRYWLDEPGLDAMCFFTENHQLVWHAAEYLAGSLFPEATFTNDGRPGAEHAEHGKKLATEWLRRRLAGGLAEFDSNSYLAIDVSAALSIVEFGTDAELHRLATALVDRCLFTLAMNTWGGSMATAHGRSYAISLRTCRFEEAAALSWAAFGSGAIGDMLLPAVVLATAQRYQVPQLARDLAAGQQRNDWIVQRFTGDYRFAHDLLNRDWDATSVIFRTPNVVLSSAQDYRCGLPGLQEHVWGATLGSEAQIFVTHPPNCSVSGSSRPNAWAGNRILPRVRQHHEVLLAIYRWPADDPMSLTHAWFPTAHFDEWTSQGDWLVARVGRGFVAIGTPGGAYLQTTGPNALSEALPKATAPGRSGDAWACIVGQGGNFDDFVKSLPNLEQPQPDALALQWKGRRYELSWRGAFLIDGASPDLDPSGQLVIPATLTGECVETDENEIRYHLEQREYRVPRA